MEGIRFRETPEQRRERMRASINWKLERGYMLSEEEHSLLEQSEASAALELAMKIEAESINKDMEAYSATCQFK